MIEVRITIEYIGTATRLSSGDWEVTILRNGKMEHQCHPSSKWTKDEIQQYIEDYIGGL